MKTVLIVEDDPEVSHGLCGALREEGYAVTPAQSAREAVTCFEKEPPGLVLLDLGLPDRDGMDLLAEFSSLAPEVPVLILTARESVENRVAGLDLGASDYILKPFALPELLARIRLHLRRGGVAEQTELGVGALRMDLLTRRVEFTDHLIDLPPKEFDLLATLMRAAGHPVSREQIAQDVWNSPRRMSSLDNLIDVHISRLRERLKTEAPGIRLRTVRGLGYTLEEA